MQPDIPIVLSMPHNDASDWMRFALLALLFLPLAAVIAAALWGASRRATIDRRARMRLLLMGIAGAIVGNFIGAHLYNRAHGPTPAIVYFFLGTLLGGLTGVFSGAVAGRIVRRLKEPVAARTGATPSEAPRE